MSALRLMCTFGLCLITAYSVRAECNNNGYKNAEGICQCIEGFYGKACECSSDYGLPLEACMSDYGRNSSIICSNRGECVCGMCDCYERRSGSAQRYTGRFCQCDDFSCDYVDNRMCNGHGTCECGSCNCDELYTGEACEFTLSPEPCVSHYSGMICNGQGECVYGKCKCEQGYMGPQCDDCIACPSPCGRLEPCAFCIFDDSASNNCSEVCKSTTTMIVEELGTGTDEKLCQFWRDDGTKLQFTYTYVDSGYLINLPKMLEIDPLDDDNNNNSPSSANFSGGFYNLLAIFILLSTTLLLQTF